MTTKVGVDGDAEGGMHEGAKRDLGEGAGGNGGREEGGGGDGGSGGGGGSGAVTLEASGHHGHGRAQGSTIVIGKVDW